MNTKVGELYKRIQENPEHTQALFRQALQDPQGALKAICKGGWLMIEHHHDQSDAVLEMMNKSGLKDVESETDLQGIRRFALGRNP